MKKIVLGLSGGLDSTTLLGMFLDKGYEVHACLFMYGSKHNIYEQRAAQDVINFYQAHFMPVFLHTFNLPQIFADFKSNLLKSGGDIPEGHYNDENMKLTVVPGRNLIFASIMAGLAESIGAESIALGVHAGDHAIYPDCRPLFINALNDTIQESTERKVNVITPILNYTKGELLEIGINIQNPPVPYHITRTCYKDQVHACGKCGSCVERLEAFEMNNLIDPITYE